jgi:hypothetical protein
MQQHEPNEFTTRYTAAVHLGCALLAAWCLLLQLIDSSILFGTLCWPLAAYVGT